MNQENKKSSLTIRINLKRERAKDRVKENPVQAGQRMERIKLAMILTELKKEMPKIHQNLAEPIPAVRVNKKADRQMEANKETALRENPKVNQAKTNQTVALPAVS